MSAPKSDSLLLLLQNTKAAVCLAPLFSGGLEALAELRKGNYVSALLGTGTAVLMTLMLIGGVVVGQLLVSLVGSRMPSGKSESAKAAPTEIPAKKG